MWMLLAISALAWNDCGIAPGDRWWVTKAGLVRDGGTAIIEDWSTCDIPAGVTLGVLYDERDTATIDKEDEAKILAAVRLLKANAAILRVRIEIHMDGTGDPIARGEDLVAAARGLLTVNGITPDRVEIVNRGATVPLVAPEVTDQDRAKNRRVDVIVVQVGSR